jgi:hypothetical protein
VVAAINLSPAVMSAVFLSLGIMTLQPFVLSLIPVLGGHRLLGTYFGFYYLVQGLGASAGNLTLGAAFDLAPALGFPSVPWLLLLSLGLASALSMLALDGKRPMVHVEESRRAIDTSKMLIPSGSTSQQSDTTHV